MLVPNMKVRLKYLTLTVGGKHKQNTVLLKHSLQTSFFESLLNECEIIQQNRILNVFFELLFYWDSVIGFLCVLYKLFSTKLPLWIC